MWKSIEKLKSFFSGENKYNYMSINRADKSNSFRYEKYFRNDVINYKNTFGNLITKAFFCLQKLLLINKRIPNNYEIYKGLVYVSITSEFANYILIYLNSKEGKKFMKFLKWSFIPEEFFFQSIIMNSPFEEKVINNNKRYVLWKEKNGTSPGVLDIDDFNDIYKSDSFFMKKVDLEHSLDLMNSLKRKMEVDSFE